MIPFMNDLTQSLNSRNDVDVMYFDFAKTFDSVNHDIILEKLKRIYNIDGLMLNLIKAYLKDRHHKVAIGGEYSNVLPSNSGVPQGSILRPLLFVIYINDISEAVSDGTQIALYADDTKIWREIRSYSDCVKLNNNIKSLTNWAEGNKMKFHPTKCKALSSSLKRGN